MTQPSVVVLDYGSGNVRSAVRALERAGCSVTLTASPERARAADGLVVPGVGAFAACMAGLESIGARELVRNRLEQGRSVLGICVGMQVLFEGGVEHGVEAEGFGEWQGVVEQLDAPTLPHMGWNTVDVAAGSPFFAGVESERFYFVHSYGVREWTGTRNNTGDAMVSWTRHGSAFISAVECEHLTATQFHPEKSGKAGHVLLRNWLSTL